MLKNTLRPQLHRPSRGVNKARAQYFWNLANTGDAQCTVPITNDPSTGTVLKTFV